MQGDDIKRLREKAGMTQKELAAALGVTQAAVCHIENQRRGITGPMAMSLAAILEAEYSPMQDDAVARISLMRKIPNLAIEKIRALNSILANEKERPSVAVPRTASQQAQG